MKLEVISSKDGSSTIRRSDLNETYHSIHGALAESRHVFIKNGVDRLDNLTINIFEVGFGTGLNVMTTLEWLDAHPDHNIIYHSIEAFPVPLDVINQLNYGTLLNFDGAEALFYKLHEVSWDTDHQILPNLRLRKIHKDYLDFTSEVKFDCVFFDAFAPNKQADMWDIKTLNRSFKLLKSGGWLTTYCAKGQLKRDLKEIGFQVTNVPGPPGKREMTLGQKL